MELVFGMRSIGSGGRSSTVAFVISEFRVTRPSWTRYPASFLQPLARRDVDVHELVLDALDVRAGHGAAQAERAADRAASTRLARAAVESRRERNVCSWATTAAPSPMAAPTRFTEPQRTSPMAKIPSTPVSNGSSSRPVERTSAPARTKPFSSSGMPHPASQLAAGSAPVKRNKWEMACSSSFPVRRLRQRMPRSPWSAGAQELDDLGLADHPDVGAG